MSRPFSMQTEELGFSVQLPPSSAPDKPPHRLGSGPRYPRANYLAQLLDNLIGLQCSGCNRNRQRRNESCRRGHDKGTRQGEFVSLVSIVVPQVDPEFFVEMPQGFGQGENQPVLPRHLVARVAQENEAEVVLFRQGEGMVGRLGRNRRQGSPQGLDLR